VQFNRFVKHIQNNHRFDDLPGQAAQLRMAPGMRHQEIKTMGAGKNPVKSGVILLVYPAADKKAYTVFIKRPVYDGVHSGQISLPGGRYENSDQTTTQTALREAQEEIGIDPAKVEVAGTLTDLYIPPSNYLVTPVLGIIYDRPVFTPDKKEVDSIIEVPLHVFTEDHYLKKIPITMSTGESADTPCFLFNGHIIWGATAMMLAEFKDILAAI